MSPLVASYSPPGATPRKEIFQWEWRARCCLHRGSLAAHALIPSMFELVASLSHAIHMYPVETNRKLSDIGLFCRIRPDQ
jgi:hypothetical protein